MNNIDAQLLNALRRFSRAGRNIHDMDLPLREKIRLWYSMYRPFLSEARTVARKPPASAS